MRAYASPALRLALAVILLMGLIPLPSRIDALSFGRFARVPLELPLIVLILCCVPPRAEAGVRLVLVAALGALTVLRLADIGMGLAFQRRFDLVLDLHLLASGWELASGTVGRRATAMGAGAAILTLTAVMAGLFWALGGAARIGRRWRIRLGAASAGVLALGLGGQVMAPGGSPGGVLVPEVADRVARVRTMLGDETRFAADLRREDLDGPPDFAALAGRDVIFLFVESYGRSWLERPPFRETGRARLRAAEETLSEAGFSARSGWMRAPTRGGQSWLAHGAAMSGLWTSSQPRYEALIASDRVSLNRLFARAGWRTAAIMPAITRAWPEAEWFGYDAIHDSDGLGYAGEPFDWVTMPDQYTLSAMDRLVRGAGPVMVEAALISSHAPWTPIPEIVPWDRIGDGAIFDGNRRAGGTPREVWSEPDSIRAAYSRSLDYALEVVALWIARSAGDALVVVLGDHQPAPLVTGPEASAAVPVHVIARDAALPARLRGRWSDGLLPATDLPERSMTEIRALFAACYSTGGCDAD